jgi:hypothetical protein
MPETNPPEPCKHDLRCSGCFTLQSECPRFKFQPSHPQGIACCPDCHHTEEYTEGFNDGKSEGICIGIEQAWKHGAEAIAEAVRMHKDDWINVVCGCSCGDCKLKVDCSDWRENVKRRNVRRRLYDSCLKARVRFKEFISKLRGDA